MNTDTRLNLPWSAAAVAAIVLIAVGGLGSYVATRAGTRSSGAAGAPSAAPSATSSRPPSPPVSADVTRGTGALLPDVVVTLSDEAVTRAGLVVAAAESGPTTTALRLPAVVEPNAYKQVAVTPLVAGRITTVLADLGAQVRQGQTMATVFSPELADAQTRYISARAALEAHERELARTEKLVQIGSASRQELERIHAEHTARRTSVASARSRLELLGLSRETIDRPAAGSVDASTDVPAPIAGVVTERLANVGLNVDQSSKLFTVVDLSTVWIVADLYERDFSHVRVGDRATIVTSAYPDVRLQGRVSYIHPLVSPETRTAKVRLEVPNPRRELRLGMLAEAQIERSDRATAALIPRSAVQNVADRSFVYIQKPEAPAQFVEREVRLGQISGERVQVVSGLMPGDRVVVEGSFFLRAERERLGLRPAGSDAAPGSGEAPIGRNGAEEKGI